MKKKRILALFLAAVSCLSLAVSASAAGTTTCKATDFKDYDRTAWYAEAVSAAVDNGLLYGKSSTIIDPNGDMTRAEIRDEKIIDVRFYHTIKEGKNGEGPHPIRTPQGWLHMAHGVRACAAGLRYVLYMYMTALDDPSRLIAMPAGYALAPEGEERVGDVSNVLFSNGWIADDDGWVFLYYASSDTRMHVATSTVDRLVDYCLHTPSDGLTTAASVERLNELIDRNLDYERKNNR